MADNCICVRFDMSSVVGIQVSHPCIRAVIIQDLQRFNSACILIFDNMLLVETNINFASFLLLCVIFQLCDGLRTYDLLGALLIICIDLLFQ